MNTTNTTTAIPGPSMPSGHFGTLQDVYDVGGQTNVNRFSNADRKGTGADLVRIQRVMLQVDVQIMAFLGRNGIPIPDAGSGSFALLTQAFGWLVLVTLYQARGDTQTDGDEFGRFNSRTWRENAAMLMEQYARGAIQNIEKRVRIGGGDGRPCTPIVIIR